MKNLNLFELDISARSALNKFRHDAAEIAKIISLSHKITFQEELSVSELFQKIALKDRALFSTVFDSLFTLPSLFLLHGSVSNQLSRLVNIGPLHTGDLPVVRVDFPGESKHLDPWHQESSYYDAPSDSFTVWLPFDHITLEHGPVEFIDNSGEYPILPVRYSKTRPYVKIINEDEFIKHAKSSPLVDLGQAVFFSHRQIHRSMPNSSNTPRCSIQFRYNRLNNSEYISRGAPRSFKAVSVHNWDESEHKNRIF